MAKLKINLDDKQHEIEVGANETILDAALAKGIEAPYSCRSAICSTCMAKLVEGEVDMIMNHVLTDEEIEEGFIVTCQSRPKSDVVVIDYNV